MANVSTDKDVMIEEIMKSTSESKIPEKYTKFVVDFNEIHSCKESEMERTVRSYRDDHHVVYVIG